MHNILFPFDAGSEDPLGYLRRPREARGERARARGRVAAHRDCGGSGGGVRGRRHRGSGSAGVEPPLKGQRRGGLPSSAGRGTGGGGSRLNSSGESGSCWVEGRVVALSELAGTEVSSVLGQSPPTPEGRRRGPEGGLLGAEAALWGLGSFWPRRCPWRGELSCRTPVGGGPPCGASSCPPPALLGVRLLPLPPRRPAWDAVLAPWRRDPKVLSPCR